MGPYLAACLVLTAAGAAKTFRPGDTARAVAVLVPLRPPVLRTAVRAGAVVEAGLGVVAAALPGPLTAGAVALSYLGFAGFVGVARLRGGPLATCGCFGTPDTPATRLHLVVDLLLAAVAAVVAGTIAAAPLPSLLNQQPWHGVPLVLLALACTWLLGLTLTALPRLGAARLRLGITRGPSA